MSEHDHNEHTSFIKTPQQLIAVIVLAFVVPIGIISIIASLVSHGGSSDAPSQSEEAILKRIRPVGEVAIDKGGAGAKTERTGQQIVETVCAACHATGTLNAPKIGDAKAWAPHIKESLEELTQIAIKGKGAMPPRGGNPDLSDLEVARAVAYMANQSGAKFAEPAAPAATAAATPAPAATATAAKPGAAPAAAGGDAKGKSVFDASCAACHATGVAGAPKVGDKAAWAPRIKQGLDAMHASAIKGKGAMPPKGGNLSLTDADVSAAVDFMVGQSR